MPRLRTLHVSLRVNDITRSLAFYAALGYQRLGQIDPDLSMRLDLLKLPDDPFVTLELVSRPGDGPVNVGNGFHCLVVQVVRLEPFLAELMQAGLTPEPLSYPGGPDGPKTSWLTDPDGYRLELVEWPDGHTDGMTLADLPAPR